MMRMIQYIAQNSEKFVNAVFEHIVFLVIIPVAIATLISLPLGIICSRHRRTGKMIMNIVSILQTIPSLALLAFMITIGLGIGFKPAITALVIYSLLPITRNVYLGLTGIDRSIVEAARGMGFDNRQLLFKVEIPLAVPVILGGIRTAAVTCIGTGVLAAYIGAGGLGTFIVTGLSQVRSYIIMAGALPATVLAVITDFLLAGLERYLTPRGIR